MKKKSLIILLVCILLAVALTVALILLLDKDSVLWQEKELDSDGDGRPDRVDVEPDDNTDDDNVTKVEDFFPNGK